MAIRAVYCQLNGHELALRLDLGAMAALEDHGIGLQSLVERLAMGEFSPKSIRFILWAMLQGEDAPPSLKDVGKWVDGENFAQVTEKIGEALRLAFPEKSKEAPPDPRPGVGIGEPPSASPPAPSA